MCIRCGNDDTVYQAVLTDNNHFNDLLVSPTMLSDHSPSALLEALKKVIEVDDSYDIGVGYTVVFLIRSWLHERVDTIDMLFALEISRCAQLSAKTVKRPWHFF